MNSIFHSLSLFILCNYVQRNFTLLYFFGFFKTFTQNFQTLDFLKIVLFSNLKTNRLLQLLFKGKQLKGSGAYYLLRPKVFLKLTSLLIILLVSFKYERVMCLFFQKCDSANDRICWKHVICKEFYGVIYVVVILILCHGSLQRICT